MEVFNFREEWKLVSKIINRPKVQKALDRRMYDLLKQLPNNGYWEWHSGKAPYLMTHSDYWCFRPKPRKHSVEWYQAFGRCHWLADFCCELGKAIYPKLYWEVICGDNHSTAIGFGDYDIEMIFDILMFESMTAQEILDFVGG